MPEEKYRLHCARLRSRTSQYGEVRLVEGKIQNCRQIGLKETPNSQWRLFDFNQAVGHNYVHISQNTSHEPLLTMQFSNCTHVFHHFAGDDELA